VVLAAGFDAEHVFVDGPFGDDTEVNVGGLWALSADGAGDHGSVGGGFEPGGDVAGVGFGEGEVHRGRGGKGSGFRRHGFHGRESERNRAVTFRRAARSMRRMASSEQPHQAAMVLREKVSRGERGRQGGRGQGRCGMIGSAPFGQGAIDGGAFAAQGEFFRRGSCPEIAGVDLDDAEGFQAVGAKEVLLFDGVAAEVEEGWARAARGYDETGLPVMAPMIWMA